jgi:hypothetical protein
MESAAVLKLAAGSKPLASSRSSDCGALSRLRDERETPTAGGGRLEVTIAAQTIVPIQAAFSR